MSPRDDADTSGDPVELVPAAVSGSAGTTTAAPPARIRLLWYPRRLAGISWADDLVAECETFPEAIAMPVTAEDDAKQALSGAVYTAQGALVRHSERGKTNRVWKGSAAQLPEPLPVGADRLEGRTFFAGHHRNSFGHVLLELLPRFWPDEDYNAYDTFLFYPQRAGRSDSELGLRTYAQELLVAATGRELPPLRIVADRPLRVAELTVSSPTFWLKRGFSPALKDVFDRVGHNLTRDIAPRDAPSRIYLSRSHLTGSERRAENEGEIETIVERAGFQVIHPQELTVREQVALARGAEAIVGCDGSALHLAAFAPPGTKLVALDSRSVPNQFLIDHLSGLDAVHVMAVSERIRRQRTEFWDAELPRVEAALELAGLTT